MKERANMAFDCGCVYQIDVYISLYSCWFNKLIWEKIGYFCSIIQCSVMMPVYVGLSTYPLEMRASALFGYTCLLICIILQT